jgi:glycosyltransferase involved in cell wall biosynthesis
MRVRTIRDDGDTMIDPGDVSGPLDVSVILPAYNESDSIDGVYEQVAVVMDEQPYSYEIIFVDDGSTDGTWERIVQLAQKDLRVRGLRHRRNFGKASALANGFTYARGEIIVTSDADMQYDPKDIVRLIEKTLEGFDIVSAYKVVRRDPLSKRIPSRFFNFFVRTTTGVNLHDMNAGLKAFRHDAAQELIRYGYGELHRFFVVLAARQGFTVAEVPVESLYRTTGRSKYGMERYMRGALDYMTVFFLSGYAERPLHLLGATGVWLTVTGSALFWTLFIISITSGQVTRDSPFFGVSELLVITGVQMLVSGLIAEMINNLERPRAGRAKIAQTLRIDRRTSGPRQFRVEVDRRADARDSGIDAGLRVHPHPHAHESEAD